MKKQQNNIKNLEIIRHSLSHLLAMAILEIFPKAKPGVGPAIENGFYYDFDDIEVGEKDLPKIEKRMRELIKKGLNFKKQNISTTEAKKIFKNQPYKLELIKDIQKEKDKISIYQSGYFIDLCKGPHIKNTKEINLDAFKLTKIAGAYWRGDEKNKMLSRIYGVAFNSKKELNEYLEMIKEAEKRDYRKLGKELDLFHIDETVGLGLPLWHPKGALLWRIIEDFWHKKHLENEYELVRSPHIGNRILWETSGHWNFYNASMYPPLEVGQTLEEKQQNKKAKNSEEYLLKPMNCPFHVKIYENSPKSYRDLPIRWAECGTVYRFEKRGELSGLTRVRGFTQDDAHIICPKNQVEKELKRVIDFIEFIYNSFGFKMENVYVYLSLRDPKNKKKYAGNDAGWKFTESILRKVAKEKKLNFKEEIGEAAFYGPKLDFKIKDVLGREWQCSTLQFDFNLPERFNMSFINEKNKKERPYMLHRALFGSFERFIGLLIEHFAGAFPLWLAPVQVEILPISQKQESYGKKILEALKKENIRAEMNNPNETLSKRIREAEIKKIPYVLVVGDKEIKNKTASIRHYRRGQEPEIKIEKLIEKIKKEIEDKAI
ncbi:threonine--tRNA ligase [Candidatus Wolfebacteria bacterium]|nr:threonine--tRNA ligase [Candidatus Wolfebacteria bacterium]